MSSTDVAPLTDAQLATYRDTGYLVLPGLFDIEDVVAMRVEARRLLEFIVNASLATGERSPRLDVCARDDRVSVRKIQPVNDLSPVFTRISEEPRLHAVLHALLGADAVLMEEKLNYKQLIDAPLAVERAGDSFEYHHDHAYFAHQGYPVETLTVGIMIDPTTPENGPMRMIPGSHKREWPLRDGNPLVAEGAVDDSEGVDILGGAGDVLIFDSRLVHASADNTTDRPRRLVLFSYYPAWHRAEPDQRNRRERGWGQAHEARYREAVEGGWEPQFIAPE